MCSSLLPTAAWDWRGGWWGVSDAGIRKIRRTRVERCKIPWYILFIYIYIYHEISLAMSWMLPDELVLISNKLLIETPRSETKRNRIAVILGGSVYWAYLLPVLVQQWASSSFQDGTCCTSLYGAVRTRTVFVPGWTEVWLQWKSHNVGNPRPKTIKNHVQ